MLMAELRSVNWRLRSIASSYNGGFRLMKKHSIETPIDCPGLSRHKPVRPPLNSKPTLFLIAGHNGAGKSSIGPSLLPPQAAHLSIFDGDQAILAAYNEARQKNIAELAMEIAQQQTFLQFSDLCQQAIQTKRDFAYEGHFVRDGAFENVRQFRDAGFWIEMIFLGLDSLQLSKERVNRRASLGGHYVPGWTVEYNYENNPKFIDRYLPMIDRLTIFNTSSTEPSLLLAYERGQLVFKAATLPQWLSEGMPGLLEKTRQEQRQAKKQDRDQGPMR